VGAIERFYKRSKPLRKRIKHSLGLGKPYQEKRVAGTAERWEMIRRELDARDRSLLDLGCNVGAMTELAASGGRFALGLEREPRLFGEALKRARGQESLAFMCYGIDPESVLALPAFDVVLCLSVHHHWVRNFGEGAAWQIVGELLRRSRSKFFFEPASVKRKCGTQDLDFEDLDTETIVEYNVKHLEAVAEAGQSIRLLGETACLGTEPFRLLFLIERSDTTRGQ
jgi:SAM-dependent methyltransferase